MSGKNSISVIAIVTSRVASPGAVVMKIVMALVISICDADKDENKDKKVSIVPPEFAVGA